jgi:hypothetical protein
MSKHLAPHLGRSYHLYYLYAETRHLVWKCLRRDEMAFPTSDYTNFPTSDIRPTEFLFSGGHIAYSIYFGNRGFKSRPLLLLRELRG